MFEDTLVVQSAISAFNNAALAAPTFFWQAVLAMPLMAMAYFCGADFMARIGWRRDMLRQNSYMLSVAVILIWIVMFGGNYEVLRDATSVLPFVVAVVLGLCGVCMGARTRGIALPRWRGVGWRRRGMLVGGAVIVALAVMLSGMRTWWGLLMPVVTLGLGMALGRATRRDVPVPAMLMTIMMIVVTAVLMQPEFFRFGQLGNLTIVHLVAVLVFGVTAAAVVALRFVRPSSRVHRSAYIKLKWMTRFVAALGTALFVLTESVPVFLGTVVAFFVTFALSVWHEKTVDANLAVRMMAVAMMLFGGIVTLPLISALGVMIWADLPKSGTISQARFLL